MGENLISADWTSNPKLDGFSLVFAETRGSAAIALGETTDVFRPSAEKTDVILSASVAFDEGSLARQPPARPPVDAARLFDVKQVMGAAPGFFHRGWGAFSQILYLCLLAASDEGPAAWVDPKCFLG